MRRRPGRIARAVIAALVGLGSSLGVVAAAGPNQLSNGWVSPTSGTTSIAFTFSVDFRSDREFAATSVVAVVAGRSVALQLASGKAWAGTFRGTSALPAGRWPVSFEAQATQGPSATLSGPTIVVTAPAPPPTATPKPPPPPTPPPPPPPPPAPAPDTTAPVPRASTPGATPQPQQSAAATTPAPTRSLGVASSTSSAPSNSDAPSATSGMAVGPDVGDGNGESDDNPTGMLLGLGVLSAASVASVAAVVVRRRRAPGEAPPEVGAERIPSMSAVRPTVPAAVEDPILIAMGLGTASHPDPNAPITRSVRYGPGERPSPPNSRAH